MNATTKALLFKAPWTSFTHAVVQMKKTGLEVELVDVTEARGEGLAYKYGIKSLPTILFLDGDRELVRTSTVPAESLIRKIKRL